MCISVLVLWKVLSTWCGLWSIAKIKTEETNNIKAGSKSIMRKIFFMKNVGCYP